MSNAGTKPDSNSTQHCTITEGEEYRASSHTFSIFLSPPYFDEKLLEVEVSADDGNTGGSRRVESRQAAKEYIQEQISNLTDDPDATTPKIENSHLYAYPGLEAEFTLPELFGNSTLGAFTTSASETPLQKAENWYELTEAYSEWLEPIKSETGPSNQVLTYTTPRHNSWNTYWVRYIDGDAQWITYTHRGHSWDDPEPAELTKVVRAIGAHGLIYPALATDDAPHRKPADALDTHVPDGTATEGAIGVSILPAEQTPFHDDYSHPYLQASGHPQSVNGWEFTPEASGFDSWTNPDGTITVETRRTYVQLSLDGVRQDLSSTHVVMPEDSPDRRDDDVDVSRAELRTIAVNWMENHPADTYGHPLQRYPEAISQHQITDLEDTTVRVTERQGTLECKIIPSNNGKFAHPDDLYTYLYRVEGEVTPTPEISPEHTTGFTATRVTSPAPGAANTTREELTEGSLIDALDVALEQVQNLDE